SPPLGTGTARLPVQHTYTAAGTYTVVLTATNAYGTDAYSSVLTIASPHLLYLPLVMKE
ncbi:MAG: PKD domain-containing protein, partial [Caldilineae bacterium]